MTGVASSQRVHIYLLHLFCMSTDLCVAHNSTGERNDDCDRVYHRAECHHAIQQSCEAYGSTGYDKKATPVPHGEAPAQGVASPADGDGRHRGIRMAQTLACAAPDLFPHASVKALPCTCRLATHWDFSVGHGLVASPGP